MPPGDGARALIDWYVRSASAWLAPRGWSWTERIRATPSSIAVRDLGRRWGSAGQRGAVALHWALFQLPPALVDYVLVHELVHLDEPHHGKAFWRRLDRALPDYQQRRARLADLGRHVWLGDVYVREPPTSPVPSTPGT